jgi:hypothetical protein
MGNRVARSFLRSARNVSVKAESRNRLHVELDGGIHVGFDTNTTNAEIK